MKKKILLFSLIAGLGIYALSSYHTGAANNGYDCTGAEAGGTGTFANPTGCTTGSCHGSAATTTVGVTIELDSAGVPTTHYKGGMTYTVKISGNNGTGLSLGYFGFQLAAMKGTATAATVTDAGTWATTGLPPTTHIAPPQASYTYLTVPEQSSKIAVTGTTCSESFSWTAPTTGTGTISFWGVINFVNGNGSADAGDKWNTTSLNISEWSTVSVPSVLENVTVVAFPNPCHDLLKVSLGNTEAGSFELNVFDLSGRSIASKTIEVNGTSSIATLNTSNWIPGVYQMVISKDGAFKNVSILKQ